MSQKHFIPNVRVPWAALTARAAIEVRGGPAAVIEG